MSQRKIMKTVIASKKQHIFLHEKFACNQKKKTNKPSHEMEERFQINLNRYMKEETLLSFPNCCKIFSF